MPTGQFTNTIPSGDVGGNGVPFNDPNGAYHVVTMQGDLSLYWTASW